MAGGEHDAIPVGPVGRPGSVFQGMLPQGVCGWSESHRCTGVSAVGLLDGVDGEEANGIYRPPRDIAADGGFGNSF